MPTPQEQVASIRRNRDSSGRPPSRAPNVSEGTGQTRGVPKDKKGKKKGKPNYRERLRSPGQRATIPDEDLRRLDKALYERRMQQRKFASPFTEGSPLTYGDVARERAAEEKLRFGPEEADLAAQMREAEGFGAQRMVNIGNWFDQYKNDLEKAKSAATTQYGEAIGTVKGAIDSSQAASDAERARIDADMRTSAEQRGQTYTPSNLGTQAAESRRGMQDALVGLLGTQQSAQTSYFGARQGVGSAAQLSERLRETGRQKGEREEFGRAKKEIATQKGAFRTDYMGKRREEERRNVLENKAFGLDVAKAESDATQAAADRKEKARSEGRKTNQWGYTNKEWRAMSPGKRQQIMRDIKKSGKTAPDRGKINEYGYSDREWRGMSVGERRRIIKEGKGGKDGLTPAEQRQERKRIEDIRGKTERFSQDVDQILRTNASEKDRQNLETGKNRYGKPFNSVVVQAGLEVKRDGFISEETARRMKNMGVRVPSRWRQRGPRRPQSSNPGAGQ